MTSPSCSSMRRKVSDGWAVGRLGGWAVALLLLTAEPPNRLTAQDLPLNAGALFLVFPVGAQAVGMGQTATAAAGRGGGGLWNPAGLPPRSEGGFPQDSAKPAAGPSTMG